MYGVCDGHGPFGHLVSFRLVQTLPFYLSKSDWCSLVLKMFDVPIFQNGVTEILPFQ